MNGVMGHLLHVQFEQAHHLECGHDLLLALLAISGHLCLRFKQAEKKKIRKTFSQTGDIDENS